MGLNITRKPGESVVLFGRGRDRRQLGTVMYHSGSQLRIALGDVELKLQAVPGARLSLKYHGLTIGSVSVIESKPSRVSLRFCMLDSVGILRAEVPRIQEVASVQA